MAGMDSEPLNTAYVLVQPNRPQNPPDGLIWIDSSKDDRPAESYSAATDSWGPVGIVDYNQLQNAPTGVSVDSYVSGTLDQDTLTRGITVYVDDSGGQSSGTYNNRSGTLGGVYDFPAGYEGAYVDMIDYNLQVTVSNADHPNSYANPTFDATINGTVISESEVLGNGVGSWSVSDTINVDPMPLSELVTSKFDMTIDYDLGAWNNAGDYSVNYSFTSDLNVVTNLPHVHDLVI